MAPFYEGQYDVFFDTDQYNMAPSVLVVSASPTHDHRSLYAAADLTPSFELAYGSMLPIDPSMIHAPPSSVGSGAEDDSLAGAELGGFDAQDVIPQPFTDEATGQQIFPCPHCHKQYTGKHARSIWRRHLQDKHAIPLSQQPRRTRWDNVENRPKTDGERRERTLESKRRWARKNRASQRAKAAGLPMPTDADFDEDGYPLPGTQLAAVVGGRRGLNGSGSDAGAPSASREASPMMLDEDESFEYARPSRYHEIGVGETASPHRRSASLAPPLPSRPHMMRYTSEPPPSSFPQPGGLEADYFIPTAPSMRALYSSKPGSTPGNESTEEPISSLRSSFASVIHPDLLPRGYVEGCSPAKASLSAAAELSTPASVAASLKSPRRSARIASEVSGVSSEEAAMQLLALKTSSPAGSPSKDHADTSFATAASTTLSDFSFALPHDGSSPPSSPRIDQGKGIAKRMLVEDSAESAGSVLESADGDDDSRRPEKRARVNDMNGTISTDDDLNDASSTEEDGALASSIGSQARSIFANSTPRHPTLFGMQRNPSPPAYLFSSPGNTDLSRSLGLVPDSKLSIFQTPGLLRGSSPIKGDAWATYAKEAMLAQSSPEKEQL